MPPKSTAKSSKDHLPNQMVISMVAAVAIAHLLNDLIQAVLPAIYPMLKIEFNLSFSQIGLIALIYQITASLLQPFVGLYTDRHPLPYLLPVGMSITLVGITVMAFATHFYILLLAAVLVGIGSSTFHPEASRVARMASGGRFGTAQSAFQVGGNSGSAIGPLLAALIIVPNGKSAVAWFTGFALLAIFILFRVSRWLIQQDQQPKKQSAIQHTGLKGILLYRALGVIGILMLVKFTYIASISNYYTFYLMERFSLSLVQSQVYLFAFLAAVALGTFAGGPIGDKIGRSAVIWVSFLGIIPFALVLPYVNLMWTAILSIMIGLVISSAFSAMVVYAQEAMPGRVGLVSGLMFGVMFGIGGIAAAGLGVLADHFGIIFVYQLCAFLPLLGLLTIFLPKTQH
ncbi:MFS transporter [uncultured Acinetobacter sp.]|uniref:MFS transporter n=1 Tax=uncultured Acinetobacter sp. TaxID=165433 RepID=UPI00262DCAD4|nr:MFS transporter [uncultured Acinetobacter sp.]